MSKKANPTIIGGFVVGALLLLAGGFAIFGGSDLFAERDAYVAYFDEPTKGLREGANVLMNGVRIGYVSEIALLVDETTYETSTRVLLKVLPDTYIRTREGIPIGEGMADVINHERLVGDAGIRAQLEIESFVTGLLLVKVEFRPETEAIMRGVDTQYPEIPTIPSNVMQLLANLQSWMSEVRSDVNIGELSQRLGNVLKGLERLTNSSDLYEALAGLNNVINDPATKGLPGSLQATLSELQVAAADAGSLFRNAEGDLTSLAGDLKPALGRLNEALKEAEGVLAAAKDHLQGDTSQAYQLESALEEVEGAARAIQNFFDYLERNPEALLRGKQP